MKQSMSDSHSLSSGIANRTREDGEGGVDIPEEAASALAASKDDRSTTMAFSSPLVPGESTGIFVPRKPLSLVFPSPLEVLDVCGVVLCGVLGLLVDDFFGVANDFVGPFPTESSGCSLLHIRRKNTFCDPRANRAICSGCFLFSSARADLSSFGHRLHLRICPGISAKLFASRSTLLQKNFLAVGASEQ